MQTETQQQPLLVDATVRDGTPVARLIKAIAAIHVAPVYEGGQKENGISVSMIAAIRTAASIASDIRADAIARSAENEGRRTDATLQVATGEAAEAVRDLCFASVMPRAEARGVRIAGCAVALDRAAKRLREGVLGQASMVLVPVADLVLASEILASKGAEKPAARLREIAGMPSGTQPAGGQP